MAKMRPSFEKFQEELAHLVARFSKDVRAYTGPDYSEARLRDDFLNPLFAALGWDISNRAGLIQSKREVEIESRTRVGSSRKTPVNITSIACPRSAPAARLTSSAGLLLSCGPGHPEVGLLKIHGHNRSSCN